MSFTQQISTYPFSLQEAPGGMTAESISGSLHTGQGCFPDSTVFQESITDQIGFLKKCQHPSHPLMSIYLYSMNVVGNKVPFLSFKKWCSAFICCLWKLAYCHLLKSVQSYSLKIQIHYWKMSLCLSCWVMTALEAVSWIRSQFYPPVSENETIFVGSDQAFQWFWFISSCLLTFIFTLIHLNS